MLHKQSPRSLLLLVLLAASLTACTPGASPTATAVPQPPATAQEPTAAPTDTAVPPPTQPPTETAAPTDTTAPASPTEAAADTPSPALPAVGDLVWKQAGLAGKAVQSIALFPSGGNIVVAAGPNGAWRSTYDYTTWEPLSVHPQGRTSSAAISGPNVIYITGHTGCASGGPIMLQRSTDGGKTWQQLTKGPVPLNVAAVNDKLAYGTTCSSVAKTTDSGATWTELPGSKLTNYDPGTLAVSPDGQVIFAAYYSEGGTARINRSTDAGATWHEVTPKEQEMRASVLLFIVPGTQGHPEQAGTYMASSPGLVWFLPEGTDAWKLLKGDNPIMNSGGPYEITALYVDTTYSPDYDKPGPIVYTARATQAPGKLQGTGVFRTPDAGITWQPVGKGLAPRAANTLILAPHDPTANPKTQETLLTGTEDGVWELGMPGK